MSNEIVIPEEIQQDIEVISKPKFDHNFLVAVQTSNEVPAVEISRLVSALDAQGIAAQITFVGTIDYEAVTPFGD